MAMEIINKAFDYYWMYVAACIIVQLINKIVNVGTNKKHDLMDLHATLFVISSAILVILLVAFAISIPVGIIWFTGEGYIKTFIIKMICSIFILFGHYLGTMIICGG